MDPVARALLERYPLPTTPGTSNNYRRTGNERVDQNQFDVRIDHRFSSKMDQVFARISHFRETFIPVTPLPEGSGVTSGTLGPQTTRSWAFASNHQRTFSDRWLNELRVGDTRRSVRRTAATLAGAASSVLNFPGIPGIARFPNTLPTFQITGHQQLGSPANTASDFRTEVIHIADSLVWQRGRHTFKTGIDIRWEKLDLIQPPSPTGLFQFTSLFTDLPGVANTGTPLASFLLGQVQTFSIDLQQQKIRNRAHVQEYFVQDNWKVADRWTLNPGVRYTLNFPSTEKSNQAAVFNLQTQQLEYLGRDGRPRTARRLDKTNFGPRLGIVGRLRDTMVLSAGYALVWIEQAGITTPFTTPAFPFLQTVSQRTRGVFRVGPAERNGESVSSCRRGGSDRERLDSCRDRDAAIRGSRRGDVGHQLQRLCRVRDPAPKFGGQSRVACRRAQREPMVQPSGFRGRAAIHARHELSKSGPRALVPERGSRADSTRTPESRNGR